MLKGIDISMHNGTIDFNKFKENGFDVVIIKATEGVNFIDPNLNKLYEGASKVATNIGFYHFMSEKTSPSQQAIDFWNAIKDKKFNVLPCLDIETNEYKRSGKEVSNRCVEFLEKFEQISGYRCMIYTGGFFGRDILDDRVKKYKGWIAHYNVSKPMQTGFQVVGHQFTETGTALGVKGKVDLNTFTDEVLIKKDSKIGPLDKSPRKTPKKLWEQSITGNEVKALQRELNKQFNSGLVIDGYFGESTLKACVTVKQGSKGHLTKIIQERLINKGYISLLKQGGADGIFGESTVTAIKTLQRNKKLVVDGIVGTNTWKALYSK